MRMTTGAGNLLLGSLLLGSLLQAGCTTQADGTQSVNKTAVGAGIGAVAGGVLGNRLDKGHRGTGTVLGALAGAAAGGGLGYMMDRQEADLRDQLASERAQHAVEVERVREDLLKVTLANEVSFDVNSAAIKPAFQPSLTKVADVLKRYDSKMTVVGHTDFERLGQLQSAAVGAARRGRAGRTDPRRRAGGPAERCGSRRERAARRQRHRRRPGAEPPGRDPGPDHHLTAGAGRGRRAVSRRRSDRASTGVPTTRAPAPVGSGGAPDAARRAPAGGARRRFCARPACAREGGPDRRASGRRPVPSVERQACRRPCSRCATPPSAPADGRCSPACRWRSPRATGSAWSAATAPASRPCSRRWPG